MTYAEIDENGICFAELYTTGEIDSPTMIQTTEFGGHLGLHWTGTAWEPAP